MHEENGRGEVVAQRQRSVDAKERLTMSEEQVEQSAATHCYTFFGLRCEVWTSKELQACYVSCPWRFRIFDRDGIPHHYAGVPNYCMSVRSAMMRAWHRAKWMAHGEYDQHYC